jgi:hypothetical protein
VYLGATITGDGTLYTLQLYRDLDGRIQKVNVVFNQLWKFWNRGTAKIRIYKVAVIMILLFGTEVWNTIKKQIKWFEVFYQTSLKEFS